jgi:hypothetical protein
MKSAKPTGKTIAKFKLADAMPSRRLADENLFWKQNDLPAVTGTPRPA